MVLATRAQHHSLEELADLPVRYAGALEMAVGFFLMTAKGLRVLRDVVGAFGPRQVAWVVGARDQALQDDCFEAISGFCRSHHIAFHERRDTAPGPVEYAFAISWRWMIAGCERLIVLHDSLLPRYRGFAPLPNALINGETTVGVTALIAGKEYDTGPILDQKRIELVYPVKIGEVIHRVAAEYSALSLDLIRRIVDRQPLEGQPQDESQATYSLWRDEEDYRIPWTGDAAYIQRFVDSLGSPYRGASSLMNGAKIRITDCRVEPDVRIENRQPGKVIFVRDGCPVVVCGTGLLRITGLQDDETGSSLLPLTRFRSRFD